MLTTRGRKNGMGMSILCRGKNWGKRCDHGLDSDGETMETVSDFILGGSKITADGDCSHTYSLEGKL